MGQGQLISSRRAKRALFKFWVGASRETKAAAQTLQVDPVKLAMQSGEEFELLCTIDPNQVESLASRMADQTGLSLTPIGEVVAESEGFSWIDTNGIHLLRAEGYEHFR